MFKIGIKVKNIKNHIIQTIFQGSKYPTVLVVPYGQFVNAPDDLPVGILCDQEHAESQYGFVMDLQNLETLESGEIALGIPTKKARIYFRETGNINFKIGDTEGGDFAARFNELKAGFDELKTDFNDLVTAYNSHQHPTAAVGPPSPPTVSGSSSTASIDDAKIEEIELPEL
jgi:hypothetical protein